MSLGAASSFENEPRVLMVFRIVMGKLSIAFEVSMILWMSSWKAKKGTTLLPVPPPGLSDRGRALVPAPLELGEPGLGGVCGLGAMDVLEVCGPMLRSLSEMLNPVDSKCPHIALQGIWGRRSERKNAATY